MSYKTESPSFSRRRAEILSERRHEVQGRKALAVYHPRRQTEEVTKLGFKVALRSLPEQVQVKRFFVKCKESTVSEPGDVVVGRGLPVRVRCHGHCQRRKELGH